MRRALLLCALLAVAPASGAATVRSVTAPAPVLALAADGARVAYAVGFSARDCNRVYVWSLGTRTVTRLGRKTHCERTSTGNAIAAVSIAATRVLWLHYVGGNTREWTLWTAATTSPAPRRLRFAAREADQPAPIVIGEGDSSPRGDLLPYAVDRTVVVLRANGARRFTWAAPARVVALAAKDGELAVATEGGLVTLLDGSGRVLRRETFGAEIQTVRIAGDSLAVQHGRTLELRGGRTATYSLVAGAALADADRDRAAIVRRGNVSTFDLDSGGGGVVAAGTLAQLEGARLSVASGRVVSVR